MAAADVDIAARPYLQDPSALEPVGSRTGVSTFAPRDALDDLLDFDADRRNISHNVNNNDGSTGRHDFRRGDNELDGLGIDEEVKVRKSRPPIARLDEDELLSANGIPKLRRITKGRLRFRGKGHEFTDVSRLLNTYQLWLDDLFPKARFADSLAIVEKVGHKRRMQVMRREWIDEDKPKAITADPSDIDQDSVGATNQNNATIQENDSMDGVLRESDVGQETLLSVSDDRDALYSSSSLQQSEGSASAGEKTQMSRRDDDEPEPDELDDLLAENAAASGTVVTVSTARDDFEDEMEAMADVDDGT